MDLITPEGVAAHMKAATSMQDWNRRIDQVKAANNDGFPAFWFSLIVLSGLLAETESKW